MLTQVRAEWQAIREIANDLPNVELARSLTAAMCLVRQQIPWAFDVATTFTPGNPAPGNYRLTRAFWDYSCRRNPLPSSQQGTEGFAGGQCAVPYRVRFSTDRYNSTVNTGVTSNINGPLTRVWIEIVPQASGGRVWTGYARNSAGQQVSLYLGEDNPANFVGGSPFSNGRWQIERVDGLPDNCGNAPPTIQLPPTAPSTTYPITVTIGGQTRQVTVSLPGLDVSNWPDFTFTPTITIGDITATFDIGGVNISYETAGPLPPEPTNNVETEIENIQQSVTTVNNTVNNINETTTNIENTVNNITETIQGDSEVDLTEILRAIRCCCCEDEVTYESETIVSNSSGGVWSLPESTVAVVIFGSDFDTNRIRTQQGAGSSPTVYYWGWCSVNYHNSGGGERIPLQFAVQSIPCSEKATSVLVSPTYNSRCSVTAIVKRKNCDEYGGV